jgi:hypothetical protein
VVLDSDDFSEIALEKCAQRRRDRLDIASDRWTPEQVQKDNDLLGIDAAVFVPTNLREACERLWIYVDRKDDLLQEPESLRESDLSEEQACGQIDSQSARWQGAQRKREGFSGALGRWSCDHFPANWSGHPSIMPAPLTWPPTVQWNTPAGEALQALVANAPADSSYNRLIVFGSGALQMTVLPELLSADIDVSLDIVQPSLQPVSPVAAEEVGASLLVTAVLAIINRLVFPTGSCPFLWQ